MHLWPFLVILAIVSSGQVGFLPLFLWPSYIPASGHLEGCYSKLGRLIMGLAGPLCNFPTLAGQGQNVARITSSRLAQSLAGSELAGQAWILLLDTSKSTPRSLAS